MKRTNILTLVACALALTACDKPKVPTATAGDKSPVASAGDTPAPAAAPAKTAGPVELKVKWSPGRKVVLRMEQKQDSEATVPGLPQPMRQTTISSLEYSI